MFIELNNIIKTFGQGDSKTVAVNDISFSIEKGDVVVLLGPSGSGKTTLLNIIGGIEIANSGRIKVADHQVDNMTDKNAVEYRREHLGYIFQSYNLIPNLTVKENIEIGAYLAKNPISVDELIKDLGLEKQANKLPMYLSGGQQQRTAIGRAVAKNPDLLLCDEPTGALDSQTSKEILILLEKVNKKYGTTILMVTHNEIISQMASRIIRMKDGQIIEDVKNENVISAEALELWEIHCIKDLKENSNLTLASTLSFFYLLQ